MSTRESAFH